jgi:hypothetical protein
MSPIGIGPWLELETAKRHIFLQLMLCEKACWCSDDGKKHPICKAGEVVDTISVFGWLLADGRCWIVPREKSYWLAVDG